MRQRFSSMVVAASALVTIVSLSSCSGSSPTSSGGGNNMPSPNTVNISGSAFSPASITVKMGTQVTWRNNDGISHTVTSDNGAFTSSGNLGSGATYAFTFPTPGTYPYHCAIHPSMTGTVVVTM